MFWFGAEILSGILKSKVGHGDLQNLRETTKILGLFSSLAGLNFGRFKKIQYT
jgi:hypothetical protein